MSTPAIMIDDPIEPAGVGEQMRQRQWKVLLGATLHQWRSRIGLFIFVVMVLIALAGPLIAPHSPNEFVTAPNSPSSSAALFGGDNLGRDVWSRFLYGGRTVLGMSAAATIIGVALGLVVGLTAAYMSGLVDEVLMRIADVFMAFPQIVLALLLLTAFQSSVTLIVLIVGLSHAPRVARVIRGAAQQVVERDFVKAAEAVGEPRRRIIFGELMPNVTSPLLVEVGLRLTYSIGLIAAINFLGVGLQPPTSDWGLMIQDNRLAVSVQPWGVLLPVIAIALLTIGTNLLTDGFARAAIGIDRGE
ncbi:MAG TPA: ABC transporter permease [Solirubrobacteraceae bacterium]|jgi:peptide/nickel transport system permease protein|nr:ABC transporter permease [Solirubrobacteraceae bacterium]